MQKRLLQFISWMLIILMGAGSLPVQAMSFLSGNPLHSKPCAQNITLISNNQNAPTPRKNALWNFLDSESTICILSFDRKTQCSRPENAPTPTKTASGVLNWTISYYTYDGHGNIRTLTDDIGIITDTYTYDAFGKLLEQQVLNQTSGELEPVTPINHHLTTINYYLYCGEQYDADLHMYFLRARYMETDRGRFWTMDTFQGRNHDPATLHKYLYCGGDPINWIDPSGMYGEVSLTSLSLTQMIIGMVAVSMVIPDVRQAYGQALWAVYNLLVQSFEITVSFAVNEYEKAKERFKNQFKDEAYELEEVPPPKGPYVPPPPEALPMIAEIAKALAKLLDLYE